VLITITSSSLVVACLLLSQPFCYGYWFFRYYGYDIYSKFHLIRGIFPFRLDVPARNSKMKVELTVLTVYLCKSRCEARLKVRQLHSFTNHLIPCVMFFISLHPTSLLVGCKECEVKLVTWKGWEVSEVFACHQLKFWIWEELVDSILDLFRVYCHRRGDFSMHNEPILPFPEPH